MQRYFCLVRFETVSLNPEPPNNNPKPLRSWMKDVGVSGQASIKESRVFQGSRGYKFY